MNLSKIAPPPTVKPLQLVGRKHPALNRPADLIAEPLDAHVVLANRMALTLQHRRGLALAAAQVGHALRLVVWHDQGAHCIVNPIVHTDGTEATNIEGCLSLPGRWYAVPRRRKVTVEGLDLKGRPVTVEANDTEGGMFARMWQHEADHLDGLLLAGRFEEVRHPQRWVTERAYEAYEAAAGDRVIADMSEALAKP